MWGMLLFLAYVVVWIILIMDCLRRERFYALVGQGRPTKLLWLVTFLLFSPILTLLYAIFGVFKRPRDEPPVWARFIVVGLIVIVAVITLVPFGEPGRHAFSLIRDADTGELVRQGKGTEAGFELKATLTESNSDLGAASASSGSSHYLFAGRHVALFNLSDHPLAARIGADLVTRLATWPHVDRVDYYPYGEMPDEGTRLPDFILNLELNSISQIPLPAHHRIRAKLRLTAGRQFGPPGHMQTIRNDIPPIMQYGWMADLDHRSTTTGLRSAGARYAPAAENIATALAQNLSSNVTEWINKQGTMPTLPEAMHGVYRPAEDLAFLDKYNVTHKLAGSWIFVNNRTTWLIEDDRERAVVFNGLREQLAAAGWNVSSAASDPATKFSARMDHRRVHVHVATSKGLLDPPPFSPSDDDDMRYVVTCTDPFSDEERATALEALLDERAAPELVLAFAGMARGGCGDEKGNRALLDRMYAYVADAKPGKAGLQVELGHWHASQGRIDAARECLLNARTMALAEWSSGSIKSSLEKLAEAIGEEALLEQPLTHEELRAAGLQELPPDGGQLEAELEVGRPLMAFSAPPHAQDQLIHVSAVVEHDANPESPTGYRFSVITGSAEDGSHFKSTHGLRPDPGIRPEGLIHTGHNDLRVDAEAIGLGEDRFRLRLKGFWEEDQASGKHHVTASPASAPAAISPVDHGP